MIGIAGPPDPRFAEENNLGFVLKQLMRLLSLSVRRKVKRQRVDYSFVFMRANGKQLGEIARLVDAGVIRPVVDRVLPFVKLNESMALVESGRAKGKVVVRIK